MSIEEKLKEFIQSKYKSVRDFCVQSNIPPSTLATVFERGLKKTNINTIFQICDALNIDVNYLRKNEIKESEKSFVPTEIKNNPNQVTLIARGGFTDQYELTDEEVQALKTILAGMKKDK